jgi:hypothetical protein
LQINVGILTTKVSNLENENDLLKLTTKNASDLLLEEIEDLKYQIEHLDHELLLQNTEMNELRI